MCCARDISIKNIRKDVLGLRGGLTEGNIFRASQQLNINVDEYKMYVAMQMSPDSSVLSLLKLRNNRVRNYTSIYGSSHFSPYLQFSYHLLISFQHSNRCVHSFIW